MSTNTTNTIELRASVTPEGDWPQELIRPALEKELSERDLNDHIDVDALAENVARRIAIVDPARIEEMDGAIDDLAARIEELAASPGGVTESRVRELIKEYGDFGPNGDLAERVEQTRRETAVAANPDHVRTVDTGRHQDDSAHAYGAWGVVLTADEPVHWRESTVNAESEGDVLLEVYEMDYVAGERYDLGERVKTRQLQLDGGEQTVYPEVTFPEGTYFVTRDSVEPTADSNVPMKRVNHADENIDWGDLNAADVPLTFECSWQIGRQPGTSAFDQYQENGWHRTLHNWAQWECGYLD